MIAQLAVVFALQVTAGHVWQPAEPTRPYQTASPEAHREAFELMQLADRELKVDTQAFPAALLRAFDSTSPHVRQNACATVSAVLSNLRYQSGREQRHRELFALTRPLVQAAVRDPIGAVRRYALMALPAVTTESDAAMVKEVAGRMFRGDTEPFVRAMALELLLDGGRSLSGNWQLIEEGVRDPSPTVKAVAYRFAGFSGLPEAMALLLQALNEEGDPWTRISAADALRRFVPTNPEVVDAVAARVEAEKEPYIKERLTSILAELRAMRK